MKVEIKSDKINFSMPVPIGMADMAVRAMPDAMLERVKKHILPPFDQLVSKEVFSFIFRECSDVFKENRGLEIVRVKAHDGTYMSIVL